MPAPPARRSASGSSRPRSPSCGGWCRRWPRGSSRRSGRMPKLAAALLPLVAVLAACGGSGGDRAAAAGADSAEAPRVWTPDQARALRQARERGEDPPLRPAPVVVLKEGEDSAQWVAEENKKYADRVR